MRILIFVTTHTSASGVKSLSLHTQGNWGKAELGGADSDLAPCPALYLKEGFRFMSEICDLEGFEVIQECTHHGPAVSKPSIFIEIGSSPKEWGIERAGEINAEVIKHLVKFKPKKLKTAVGIGGPHHTPNFRKVQLGNSVAIGHVCPMYALEDLDVAMLEQAMEKTVPRASLVVVDWKGLKGYKEKVKGLLEEIGVEWKKTKEY
jgi:D-aminoacyl-tRNA deacylase